MQNIINFDIRKECVCACLTNIHNRQNDLKLIYAADEYNNPQIEILCENGTTVFLDLSVENDLASIDIRFSDVHDSYGKRFSIRYIDGDKTGNYFTFNWTKRKEDYFSSSSYLTMCVYRGSYYPFDIQMVDLFNISDATLSDDFEVDEDGTLKLKEVIEINVTKDTEDVVRNVTLKYDDETTSSNNCEYDSNGNLTKFGEIPITWGS